MKILKIFVTLRCNFKLFLKKYVIYVFTVVDINFYLYLLQKQLLGIIDSPKVKKILRIFHENLF